MHSPSDSTRNRLALEKSPYLLQHASNPVDWYPWGDEAFEVAKRENKPVFLSIGYSTCHWCHVMEHESFEDPEVAALLNRAFVCIKVDREERPDIDHVYMTVCQMMTGSGGWPLTLLLTPQREPFFAATYIPREALMTFVPRVEAAWRDQNDAVRSDAGRVSGLLRQSMTAAAGEEIGAEVLQRAYQELGARFDSTHAGFGTRPKFPTPHNLLFLLRYWKRSGEAWPLEMVTRTLDAMRNGGIYDQVGFGFHRYSTDAAWLVPHFEKMLYDQALLMMAYTQAWQATGNPHYRAVAEEIATYVMRDLSSPGGGFCSAEDADSEGEEGKFYVWTLEELRDVLGGDAARIAAVYGASQEGNFAEEASGRHTGANILHLPRAIDETAAELGVPAEELRAATESARRKLLEARSSRVRPHLDDKVLTDWNGLMIAALAGCGRALDRPDLVARAASSANFVRRSGLLDGDRLLHRWRDGEAAIPGMLDDYAFFTWGLLELYEATYEVHYLELANLLAARMHGSFADGAGGYFMTAGSAEALLVRPREAYDGAMPSGNSVAMAVMARLARLTGDMTWDAHARDVGRAFHAQISAAPMAHTYALVAADFLVGPTMELVIAGEVGAPGTEAMRREADRRFLPHLVTVFRPATGADRVIALAPYVREQVAQGGAATAYLCRNFACELPITDPAELGRRLDAPLR
ncbi:MAG: thioredoxin domain-containing protein [Candidatus Krumholzibacteria bacterium]|nr:thioredoxin domain-containing protein [Candidatus Krumholzibacteria bacterium]MDH4336223.1 thioredoxin domain-containing protein [Candidatus Krumholzibacteria bacterium]MDH5268864.1 thioredoxin domain-containing protein [Candidatus Krumholzibacteria bacterium]